MTSIEPGASNGYRAERGYPRATLAVPDARIELNAERSLVKYVNALLVTCAVAFPTGYATSGQPSTERLETDSTMATSRGMSPAAVRRATDLTRFTARHAGQPLEKSRAHKFGIALITGVDEVPGLDVREATSGTCVTATWAIEVTAAIGVRSTNAAITKVEVANAAEAIHIYPAGLAAATGRTNVAATVDCSLVTVLDAITASRAWRRRRWSGR